MPATNQDWSRAFALQALSDLETRDILASANAKKCHRLHFLQMAAEKLCKAYLTETKGHENVRNVHTYVARNLPIIARQIYSTIYNSNTIANHQLSEIRRLAKEIEVLAPACDSGDIREDNSEYPWPDGKGNVRIPCEYNFPGIDDSSHIIGLLIRLLRTASQKYI